MRLHNQVNCNLLNFKTRYFTYFTRLQNKVGFMVLWYCTLLAYVTASGISLS